MKRVINKTAAAIIAASLTVISVPYGAFAEENDITVNLRIEGIEKNYYYSDVTIPAEGEDVSVYDVIAFADEQSEDIAINIQESSYGYYINDVNGDQAGKFMKWDGWMYIVNGEVPMSSISECKVNDGDNIVLYYGYMDETTSTQLPTYTFDKENGVLTFTCTETEYTEDFEPVEKTVPVKDMNVQLALDGASYGFITDDQGMINLAEAGVKMSVYEISYEKYNKDGAPLVLRNAPGESIYITYGKGMGDVNFDGTIDAIDASLVLTDYAETATGKSGSFSDVQKIAADVDENTENNALDASYILSYYAYKATGGKSDIMDYLKDNKK